MRNALPTETELVVLQLLRDHPGGLYGLELVKESDGTLKRGTVYVILSRLQDKGFIKSSVPQGPVHPGLPRRHYALTALGARAIKAMEVFSATGAEVPA